MAEHELMGRPRGLVPHLASRYGPRRFGRDLEPVQAPCASLRGAGGGARL